MTLLAMFANDQLMRLSEYDLFETMVIRMRGNPAEDPTLLYKQILWAQMNIFELQLYSIASALIRWEASRPQYLVYAPSAACRKHAHVDNI